jgi:hypothetical protein
MVDRTTVVAAAASTEDIETVHQDIMAPHRRRMAAAMVGRLEDGAAVMKVAGDVVDPVAEVLIEGMPRDHAIDTKTYVDHAGKTGMARSESRSVCNFSFYVSL